MRGIVNLLNNHAKHNYELSHGCNTVPVCWVCGSEELQLARQGVSNISTKDLKITDSRYGTTMTLFRCGKCGFIQCSAVNVLDFYEELKDPEYIGSSSQRIRQFQKLIQQTGKYIKQKKPNVLDIGAGTGLFINEARKCGWFAHGLEPSVWLSEQARQQGIPVITGTFPDRNCPGPYDAIFLTDVIEHLENPVSVVSELSSHLKDDGVVFVTTPNVSSFMAKIMGWKWWHYRIAHVGYYNKKTLSMLMARGGLIPVRFLYAKWCFDGKYVFERMSSYFPFLQGRKCPSFFEKTTITANFFDSYIAVFQKTNVNNMKELQNENKEINKGLTKND